MTLEQERITLMEACGWDCDPVEAQEWDSRGQWCVRPNDNARNLISIQMHLPRPHESLNACREAEIALGLHDRANVNLRVKWINALREIVGRECPVNKAGSPLVTDVDLLNASPQQRVEAMLKIPPKKKP